MMPLGKIAPLAQQQLAAWEELAADWATYTDDAPVVQVERCGSCHVGLYRVTDERGRPYVYADGEQRAQLVAHLRQAHLELDPDR